MYWLASEPSLDIPYWHDCQWMQVVLCHCTEVSPEPCLICIGASLLWHELGPLKTAVSGISSWMGLTQQKNLSSGGRIQNSVDVSGILN